MTREVPGIPHEAQEEILEKLFDQMWIGREEVEKILLRHGVMGDIDLLQRQYRQRKGQQLMASLRDREGRRSVLASKGGKYVVVDLCGDRKELTNIHARLQHHVTGLSVTTDKVKNQLDAVNSVIQRLRRTR